MAVYKKPAAPKMPAPNNNVRTKAKSDYIKLPATPSAKPTMRSTAKDKPLTAKEKAAGNKRGLGAANKPSTSKNAPAARSAAAKRALNVPPSRRSAGQSMALGRNLGGGGMNQYNR